MKFLKIYYRLKINQGNEGKYGKMAFIFRNFYSMPLIVTNLASLTNVVHIIKSSNLKKNRQNR